MIGTENGGRSWVFALAVLAELVAYPYSRRVDTLSNEQIRSDEQVISKLNGEVAIAKRNADSAAAASKLAKDMADEAASSAGRARNELAEVETQVLPNNLTEADRLQIAKSCRPFSNRGVKIEITTSPGQGVFLGSQIESALTNGAGFDVTMTRTSEVWYGISMGGPIDHKDVTDAVVGAIATALKWSGIIWQLPPGSPIKIGVGEKLVGPLSTRPLTNDLNNSNTHATPKTK